MDNPRIYTPEDAPPPSDEMLAGVKASLGFVPNVFAVMAGTPPVLNAFVELNTRFAETSLSATEREIVQIAVSVENGCAYCVAGHTAFAKMQKVPDDIIAALRERGAIADPKLRALHDFARAVATRKGRVAPAELERFLSAGYSQAQLQEVILGVCVKTFSNLTSLLLDIPLDDAFAAHAWHPTHAGAFSDSGRKAA
jgi:uncharacterized peroxidase-related enzyme